MDMELGLAVKTGHYFSIFINFFTEQQRWLLEMLLPLAKFYHVCFKQPDELKTHDLKETDAHNFKVKLNILLAMWFEVLCTISLLQS